MAKVVEMMSVSIFSQLNEEDGPIVLINKFSMDPADS